MKKLLLLLLFVTSYSFAQQAYYSDVNLSLTGTALRDELATKIINTHTKTLNYDGAREALKIVDLVPGQGDNVFLLYGFSNNTCPSSSSDDNDHRTRDRASFGGGSSCEWNREHVYAQSLGTPALGQSGPGADAHHLRASDVQRNSNRGSKLFASGSGNSGDSNGGWYPGDEWKGDVARIMMYMYVRYGSRCLPSNVAIGSTNSVDSNMIELLLDWNAQDPVSTYEDNRNTYLVNTSNDYGQGNRNPFIDNPNLATQIWGGTVAEDRWNVVADTENPTAPTSLAGSNITNTTVELTWNASTDNTAVTSYEIFVDGSLYATSANTSTTLTGLTINTNYDITVYAKDAAENPSASSNILNITTTNIIDNTAPSIPTALVVSNETNTTIDVSWTASTDDIAIKEYDVYIDASYLATTTATTFTVDNLIAATTYSFSVLARDTSNNISAQSIPVNGTTTATASFCGTESFTNSDAPTGGYGGESFTGDNGVTWTYVASRDDEGYEITGKGLMLRRLSDNSKVTSSAVSNGIGEFTCSLRKGFTGAGNRQVALYINGVFKGNSIAWDNTSVQTFTVSGINISGNIIVEIRNITSYQVVIDDISWTCYASSDTEAPSTIADLTSSNITSNSADLNWTAATDNIGVTSYEIFKNGVSIASTTTNSYNVSGLTASASYNFTVYAKDAAGNTSLVSNTETFTTLAGSGYCGSETFTNSNAPAGDTYATGSFIGDNSVTWTYVESKGEVGLSVDYGISGKGLMFRNTISKVTSSTVSGGIGDFTCSLRKGFTGSGDRQVELFVNGISQGTSILWDDTNVQTFSVSGINISGDVIVEIRNKRGEQVVIDDIFWTCFTGSSNPTELFISEYVEGSGFNKAIEIANFTGSSIDLSIYSLARQNSGIGGWEVALPLSGTLINGDVFVVANNNINTDPAILAVTDLPSGADVMQFNGDDPVGLFKNGVLIDVVGTYNGATGNFGKDVTLRRKPTISSPNTTYTISEWDVLSAIPLDDLGSHTLSALSVQKFVQNLFTVYPNPTKTNSATVAIKNNTTINAVQLYNLLGQLIVDIKNPATFNNKVEIRNIPAGFYIVKVFNEATYSTKRLIVE